jgi:endonuclease/exonuclease/phosphatase family metal-dependent hydrolase
MEPLRVMSFNVRIGRAFDGQNRWYRRRELVFEAIRASRSHVIGLQEVSPFQLDELLSEFPGWGAIADKRYGGRFTGTYAPIFFDASRLQPAQSGDFWLAPDPDGKRVRAWDAAVPRICTWCVLHDRTSGGSRLAMFNSHFDQAGVEARAESARLLLGKADQLGHLPRLVTADLNADESTEPLAVLKAGGFRDTFRLLYPRENADSYHGFRGRGVRRLGKIDYVLCDERWDVCAAAIVRDSSDGRFASDHFPLTAELTIRR